MRIITLIFLFSWQTVFSQEWLDLYKSSQNYYDAGEWSKAMEIGEQSLTLFKNENGELHQNYCSILRQLSIICFATGDFEKGIAFCEKEKSILDIDTNIDDAI